MAELVSIEPENGAVDVLDTLEKALAEARGGRISSVAIAMVRRDGVGHYLWSTAPMTLATLGAIRRLEHEFNRHVDGFGSTAA